MRKEIGNDTKRFAFFDSLVNYWWVDGLQWFEQRKKIEYVMEKFINEFWSFAPEPNTFAACPLSSQYTQ
jgi:hypothetical protein